MTVWRRQVKRRLAAQTKRDALAASFPKIAPDVVDSDDEAPSATDVVDSDEDSEVTSIDDSDDAGVDYGDGAESFWVQSSPEPSPVKEQGSDDSDGDFDNNSGDEARWTPRPASQASSDENPSGDDEDGDFDDDKPVAKTLSMLDVEFDSEDEDEDGDFDDSSDEDSDDWLKDVVATFPSEFEGRSRRVGLAFSTAMTRHEDQASNHPERPERITMTYSELSRQGLVDRCELLPMRRASAEELTRCHEPEFVRAALKVRKRCRAVISRNKDEPTDEMLELRMMLRDLARRHDSVYLNEFSVDCALISAAGAIDAVQSLVTTDMEHSAALIRPPGHHAECHCMMGFCVFSNVALACAAALEKGVQRILVVDWDVHHGNGTQRIFLDDPRVLFLSIHRYENAAFYPCSSDAAPTTVGDGAGAGYTANVGWNCGGAGDAEYYAAFKSIVLPLAAAFDPQLVIVSAGFDSARGDPLGGCDLTPKAYARMTHDLINCRENSPVKVAICLEGGYNCISVAKSFAACLGALLGANPPVEEEEEVQPLALIAIMRTARALLPHWPQCEEPFNAAIREGKSAKRNLKLRFAKQQLNGFSFTRPTDDDSPMVTSNGHNNHRVTTNDGASS